MRLIAPALLALLTLPAPALRAQPAEGALLDGAAFAAEVEGLTLSYRLGEVLGREHYLPGGSVIWEVEGEALCLHGSWREARTPEGPQICFVYELSGDPVCWWVRLEDGRLTATSSQSPGSVYREVGRSDTPLDCQGPLVGS